MTNHPKAAQNPNPLLCAVESEIDNLYRLSETENERDFYQNLIDDFRANSDPVSDLQEWVSGICCIYRDDHWKAILLDKLIARSAERDQLRSPRSARYTGGLLRP